MKKTEYADSKMMTQEDRIQSIEVGKQDDQHLPEFSREVPSSKSMKKKGDTVYIKYEWKNKTPAEITKIRKIYFRKEEDLSELYRIAARDGRDSICFKHNGVTYILRKTMHEIAQAIYNTYQKVGSVLENIVGYLKTVLGNEYVISKVAGEAWTFDKRIAKGGMNYIDADSLQKENKSRLCEMITEKLAELHNKNMIIGRFTLNNVLLKEDDLEFTDLRRMRVSRKRFFVIEEFKSVLQYLFAIGFASKEDVYCSIASYATHNEETCKEWYKEHKGKKPNDE